jgi:hypothetical protein
MKEKFVFEDINQAKLVFDVYRESSVNVRSQCMELWVGQLEAIIKVSPLQRPEQWTEYSLSSLLNSGTFYAV